MAWIMLGDYIVHINARPRVVTRVGSSYLSIVWRRLHRSHSPALLYRRRFPLRAPLLPERGTVQPEGHIYNMNSYLGFISRETAFVTNLVPWNTVPLPPTR